ncbi:MAG: hypothetical protein LBD89_00620 [Tannerellaceae bacterium]|jgi:hypothetical protein|nr:hypothetical protein [Tannerellaceae bacterium]
MEFIFLLLLLVFVSCGKDEDYYVEAGFTLSVTDPETTVLPPMFETKMTLPASPAEGAVFRLYYGDPVNPSFRDGVVRGNALIFDLPVFLSTQNPGRLVAKHLSGFFSSNFIEDSLYADSDDPSTVQLTYANNRYQVELRFKHTNAFAVVTAEADGKTVSEEIERLGLRLQIGNEEQEVVASQGEREMILLANSTLKGVHITFKTGRSVYLESLSDVFFESNKRYAIHASLATDTVLVTEPGQVEDWRVGESLLHDGYGREIVYIRTAADLKRLAERVNSGEKSASSNHHNVLEFYAYQQADIDLSAYDNWEPVGTAQYPYFNSVYDGNGYTITGLKLKRHTPYNGLFGYVAGANIEEVRIKACDIESTSDYNGALVGYATHSSAPNEMSYYPSVKRCTVSGSVKGRKHTQGLVGQADQIDFEGNTDRVIVVLVEETNP